MLPIVQYTTSLLACTWYARESSRTMMQILTRKYSEHVYATRRKGSRVVPSPPAAANTFPGGLIGWARHMQKLPGLTSWHHRQIARRVTDLQTHFARRGNGDEGGKSRSVRGAERRL